MPTRKPPSTGPLLRRSTSDGSAYMDYAVRRSWRQWQDAFNFLHLKCGWSLKRIEYGIMRARCVDESVNPYAPIDLQVGGKYVDPFEARALVDLALELNSSNTSLSRRLSGVGELPLKLCYHGTKEENYKSILRTGFRPGTYFAQHLEDAVAMGPYVFAVIFPDGTTSCSGWQFTSSEVIPADRIAYLRWYDVEEIYWSEEIEKRLYASRRPEEEEQED